MPTNLATSTDPVAFEAIMRRYNPRLFRVARAILKDEAAAEDALQDAYVHAYRQLSSFRGDSDMGTWLTRIVINQSLMQLRKRKRERVVVAFARPAPSQPEGGESDVVDTRGELPSDAALRGEIRRMIERRVDELPVAFRTVFVMREIEEMTAQETAAALGIPEATVRTRLFRARALLSEALERDMDRARGDVYAFAGARCDRIVAAVLARITS